MRIILEVDLCSLNLFLACEIKNDYSGEKKKRKKKKKTGKEF